MKPFLFSLLFTCLLFQVGFAQKTTPRFGVSVIAENSGRSLTYRGIIPTQAAGVDTTKITPGAYETVIRPAAALNDSLDIHILALTKCYLGDRIFAVFTADASPRKVKFSGSNTVYNGAITVAASKRATISLIFDGTRFVEQSRFVQP